MVGIQLGRRAKFGMASTRARRGLGGSEVVVGGAVAGIGLDRRPPKWVIAASYFFCFTRRFPRLLCASAYVGNNLSAVSYSTTASLVLPSGPAGDRS